MVHMLIMVSDVLPRRVAYLCRAIALLLPALPCCVVYILNTILHCDNRHM
jgi:hypothetical protein